jgi:hypothetical protein
MVDILREGKPSSVSTQRLTRNSECRRAFPTKAVFNAGRLDLRLERSYREKFLSFCGLHTVAD